MTRNDERAARGHAGATRWAVRPGLWFATASIATMLLHELAHAVVARALGVRGTLFSFVADLDWTPERDSLAIRVLIALAGPAFCLLLGALAAFAYPRARGGAASLPLLEFTVFGLGTFFGNLMSAGSMGDFATVAIALGLPQSVRIACAVAGLLGLAGLHVWAGRELIASVPQTVGRANAVLGVIVLPVLLGTFVVVLGQSPLPEPFLRARIAESAFWAFSVLGALTVRSRPPERPAVLAWRRSDIAAAVGVFLVARLVAGGIPFAP